MGGITNMPNHAAPTIRYGSAQGAFPGSPSVIGSGHGGIPSTSMYHPSMMPSYSPSYGGGRGIMISPSGGARFGGGGFADIAAAIWAALAAVTWAAAATWVAAVTEAAVMEAATGKGVPHQFHQSNGANKKTPGSLEPGFFT